MNVGLAKLLVLYMVSGKNFREIFKRNLVEFLCGFLG